MLIRCGDCLSGHYCAARSAGGFVAECPNGRIAENADIYAIAETIHCDILELLLKPNSFAMACDLRVLKKVLADAVEEFKAAIEAGRLNYRYLPALVKALEKQA
jgi:hypothetical protein